MGIAIVQESESAHPHHRQHHLQIYQPPQHQLTSVPPESPPAASAGAAPVTSPSAHSLVGTVELHHDNAESVKNETQQRAKRRAAANRHEKEQSNCRSDSPRNNFGLKNGSRLHLDSMTCV